MKINSGHGRVAHHQHIDHEFELALQRHRSQGNQLYYLHATRKLFYHFSQPRLVSYSTSSHVFSGDRLLIFGFVYLGAC